MAKPSGSLRIYITNSRSGARGPLYDARLDRPDGDVIVTGSTEPLFDAARVLHAQGMKGRLELWDAVTPYARMAGAIAKLARLTVAESERQSPTFRRFVKRAQDGHLRLPTSKYPEAVNRRPWADVQSAIGIPTGAEA